MGAQLPQPSSQQLQPGVRVRVKVLKVDRARVRVRARARAADVAGDVEKERASVAELPAGEEK